MTQEIYQLLWLFFIYAFFGWCVEVVFHAVSQGKFVNRGFLNGPICPIYGFGVLIVVLCLEPIKDNILLLFLGSVLLTSALEFLTGFVLEKFFNDKWWDYSKEPLNIHGYICLRFSLAWGLACLLIVDVIYPLTSELVELLPQTLGFILLSLFTLLWISDTVITIIEALNLRRTLIALDKGIRKVSASIGGVLANRTIDAMEMISEGKIAAENEKAKAKTNISAIQARILNAYPRLKNGRYKDSVSKLKRHITGELRKPIKAPLTIYNPQASVIDIPVALYRRTFETVIDVLEARDEYTAGHSRRVAVLVKRFSRILNVVPLQADVLELAASLHDLGKVGVPDATLNKCDKLNEDEWSEMRRHPDIGADIIIKSGNNLEHVAEIVRHHHEHWDGSGYPSGLAGKNIPKGSQIIAICDAVDSMMIKRVYRPALSPTDCKQELMRGKGSLFSPTLTDVFLENWDRIISEVYSNNSL